MRQFPIAGTAKHEHRACGIQEAMFDGPAAHFVPECSLNDAHDPPPEPPGRKHARTRKE